MLPVLCAEIYALFRNILRVGFLLKDAESALGSVA